MLFFFCFFKIRWKRNCVKNASTHYTTAFSSSFEENLIQILRISVRWENIRIFFYYPSTWSAIEYCFFLFIFFLRVLCIEFDSSFYCVWCCFVVVWINKFEKQSILYFHFRMIVQSINIIPQISLIDPQVFFLTLYL